MLDFPIDATAAEVIFPIAAMVIMGLFWWFRYHPKTARTVRAAVDNLIARPKLQLEDLSIIFNKGNGFERVIPTGDHEGRLCLCSKEGAVFIYSIVDHCEQVFVTCPGENGMTLMFTREGNFLTVKRSGVYDLVFTKEALAGVKRFMADMRDIANANRRAFAQVASR